MQEGLVPDYEVLALRYATTALDRPRHENFLPGMDLHDGAMPLDYFIWLIRGGGRTFVVDTGFGEAQARQRKRQLLHDPRELLSRVGVLAEEVADVILTHLHYDHAGGLATFPAATFHVQDEEIRFATGRNMCQACYSAPFECTDVMETVRLVYDGRVQFHDGDVELAPGIELFRIGGHTGGLQIVRVNTARGRLVLASDAFHFTENRLRRAPFPIVYNINDMLAGFDRCEQLAGGDESLLVPGHDPGVMSRWPRWRADVADIVRLDAAPIASPRNNL
jgi:glyoxylase-like metal-dependent hydrolase (beta-lactamase superfamily II)